MIAVLKTVLTVIFGIVCIVLNIVILSQEGKDGFSERPGFQHRFLLEQEQGAFPGGRSDQADYDSGHCVFCCIRSLEYGAF